MPADPSGTWLEWPELATGRSAKFGGRKPHDHDGWNHRRSPRVAGVGAASRPKMDAVACTISNKKNRGDNSRESNRGNGSGRGNGRDEAGGAAQAAGSDKRRHRSDSRVGIRPD